MKIQDFCDMNKFEQIMKNWANSTGLATVAVGADGKYISDQCHLVSDKVGNFHGNKALVTFL